MTISSRSGAELFRQLFGHAGEALDGSGELRRDQLLHRGHFRFRYGRFARAYFGDRTQARERSHEDARQTVATNRMLAQSLVIINGGGAKIVCTTGEMVSLIGVGGFHLGKTSTEDEAIRLIHAAVGNGITLMDNGTFLK